MDLDTAEDKVQEIVEKVLVYMYEIKPKACGLDNRSAYRLWISADAIAVSKSNKGSLEYYGGFEYVGADDRVELGDYVFYKADSDRVNGHIERWQESEEFNCSR